MVTAVFGVVGSSLLVSVVCVSSVDCLELMVVGLVGRMLVCRVLKVG